MSDKETLERILSEHICDARSWLSHYGEESQFGWKYRLDELITLRNGLAAAGLLGCAVGPSPGAEEAVEAALQNWFRHQRTCGTCLTAGPLGGHICSEGQRLLQAHGSALHEQLHAEILARGEALDQCGECHP